MNALLVNTSDIEGGAARAAYRLHKGLQKIGLTSKMLVQSKSSSDHSVYGPLSKADKIRSNLQPSIDNLPVHLYRNRVKSPWSISWLPSKIVRSIQTLNPDIIHLHWINHGFVPIHALGKFKKPIIWTLHDMWAFTGGCHYSGSCTGYLLGCGSCEQLKSTSAKDLSSQVLKWKRNAWEDINLTVVTPSTWMAECARTSSVFKDVRVEVIPNGIDLERFKPLDKTFARQMLNLPQDKRLILFGAMSATSDPRKGFQYLQQALLDLAEKQLLPDTELIVFGSDPPANPVPLGMPVHYTGRLNDDISLTLLYSAADVFLSPSLEDNLPNTVMEAMACGVPCVAFEIGGIPDLITHLQNGYLAKAFEVNDLAYGIKWVIEHEDRRTRLSHDARAKVESSFELSHIASCYSQLYEEVLQGSRMRA
ncbi:glycosyltransferase family 4 protein [Paenibacillus sedimenti]|uniref:Glycosyltransferase family 4 protein n=1 Tax=Paenibacillus sedimenti TaxID=2770274 RepID=A0A926QHR6_9BACL|nr:glycosyltransferase family 4 protein [Paenibacillus sedimenti]MBD0379780.1 glycosyltransferase family 4 protein [Paenibacillus sedimenti]